MRVIRCCEDGRIYTGYELKNGELSEKGRVDVTDDCITGTVKHMSCFKHFLEDGFSGFEWKFKDGSGDSVVMALINPKRYKIVDVLQYDIVEKESNNE